MQEIDVDESGVRVKEKDGRESQEEVRERLRKSDRKRERADEAGEKESKR